MSSRPIADLPQLPLPDTYWVAPGRLLAGEHPAGKNREHTESRLAKLIEAGVDFFMDLTSPEERESYAELLPRNVVYQRRAITDHGLPDSPEHMSGILATLDQALANGRCIYLHCRAGIGRTGTVVGCHLVDRGLAGQEALAELNHLWRQSARSKLWPQVPETVEQAAFVRGWRVAAEEAALEETALRPAGRLRDRFHGALLGLAIGDALSAPTQLRKVGSFTPVADMLGGGPFELPRGGWSDDTATALCMAESLLECDGFNSQDQVERYLLWQQQGHLSATGQSFGISANVARALATARWRRKPFAGSHDPEHLDPEALTRVAPVVMFNFAQAQDAVQQAAEAARTTCQAPLVLEACRLFAACMHAALSGAPKTQVLNPSDELLASLALRGPMRDLASGSYRQKTASKIDSRGRAPQALEAALWAFYSTGNFRDGALAAVNLGGRSDVIAATYGQLAGAHYGVGAIPEPWRNCLLRKDLLADFADRLLAQALIGLGDSPLSRDSGPVSA